MQCGRRQANYHSYLLRLWRADALAPWQASLHSTANGEIRHFADAASLMAFLQTRLVTDKIDLLPPTDHTAAADH